MFYKSLQWRLVIIFICINTFLMIFVGVILNKSVESSYYNTFKKGIDAGFSIFNLDNASLTDIESVLKNEAAASFAVIGKFRTYTIIDKKTLKVINSTHSMYESNTNKFVNEIMRSDNLVKYALKDQVGNKAKLTSVGDSSFFDYAMPTKDYIIYFRYDKEEWIDTIDKFNNTILSGIVISIILSFVLGYILSKTITEPIISIMHGAQKVAAGDFSQSIEVKSDDEIGKLTQTFNYMAGELKNTLIEISTEKNKLEAILNYMTDGVLAFNLKGEVIHANPISREILNTKSEEITFNEFSKKYGFGITLEEVLYLKSFGDRERIIEIEGKYIKVYFVLIEADDEKIEGIVTVLQDITEQQKLELMRKEFVANVSHELRTPLTSIKSYAETLLDGAIGDRETSERFLNVINSEADRMTRLVIDLLQLSRLDNQQMQWNMQKVFFVDLVRGSIEKLQLSAKNKEQRIESFIIGDIPEIEIDKGRIEQVVINILSNAIKYTPAGGKITVFMGRMYSEVYVKVVDTGIGIPQDELSRVFERFYRVDKARSREMGGTGLGLSIAKEIVEAHGGTISISSKIGKGTEVAVKLPICNSILNTL
jgi:two-component system, OmpR family, sensor histidine kinase VicK